MVTETVLVVLFAVTSCVGVPSREDVILADKVYQEQLKEYLKTVPTNIANEALMTVVCNTNVKSEYFLTQIKKNPF